MIIDLFSALLLIGGALFFCAGSLALLRFPDLYSRLHAVTKADNLGLGMVVLGLALQSPDLFTAAKLILVWLVILPASAVAGHLIARWRLRRDGHEPDDPPPNTSEDTP
ncbi:MAG: monovalent cation/H(+) antiporter subunit G [Gammaproteobacteria bacterium]